MFGSCIQSLIAQIQNVFQMTQGCLAARSIPRIPFAENRCIGLQRLSCRPSQSNPVIRLGMMESVTVRAQVAVPSALGIVSGIEDRE